MTKLTAIAVRVGATVAGGTILAACIATGTAFASTTAPYIREGSQGTGVKCVQRALNANFHAGLVVDGIDGTKTTAAVKAFQREVMIQVDGIVGPESGTYLYSQDENLGLGATCYPYVPTTF